MPHFLMNNHLIQKSENYRMTDRNLALGMIFLSQTMFGLLGNSSVFYNYLLLYFTRYKLNSTDWILNYLIVANFLTLLCKGVPHTIAALGMKIFITDFGCKLLFYVHKIGRGTCICSSTFMSVFQAITISNKDFRWAKFKDKPFKLSGFFLCYCCILNIAMSAYNLLYITEKLKNRNMTSIQDFGYCSICLDKTAQTLHAIFLPLPDAVCGGLLVWASISTVLTLYRHKNKMQQMIRTKTSSRSSTEFKAIKTILLQMSTFVIFYVIACIFQLFLVFLNNPSWFLVNISIIISGCFPSVSPFLLMSHYSITSSHCVSFKKFIRTLI